jgi:cytochrome c peroxidase
MFWDGRATGDTLGDPLAEQALGPFLNPAEMNNASAADVVAKVESSAYSALFAEVYADATPTVGEAYEAIGRAIAAFERSAQVSSFTSKYDAYLAGTARLTGQEMRGLQLFNGKAQCSLCHLSGPGLAGEPPLFTDFTYDNLGIPRNALNPFYLMPYNLDGEAWVDPGLGGFLQAAGYPADVYAPEMGKHKVPTLRNVALAPSKHFVKAFGHNAYFKDLRSIVHFYNTRDVPGAGWPDPEYAATINTTELGDLGLNRGEELALVAFMETLSDGYDPVSGH